MYWFHDFSNFTLKGQFENLTSGQIRSRPGQGQIMTQVGQYAVCTSSEAARRVKSFGTICASLSLSCCDLLAYWRKKGLWRHLTSGDLPVTPDPQFHPDLHRWDEGLWSWKHWVVLIDLCEARSIFIFPHRLIMGRSRNWPELRTPG